MKITYLIGNGFDLHFGLQTSYSKFYDYYISQNCADKRVQALKRKCLRKKELWADLEIALGELTNEEDNIENYINFIQDIQIHLANFCREQKKHITIDETKRSKICRDLVFFDEYLNDEQTKKVLINVKPKSESYLINFITFNYTDTLEHILQYSRTRFITSWHDVRYYGNHYEASSGDLIHIHGTTEQFMVLGLNDATQVQNGKFANDERFLHKIIKPLMNKDTLTHRAEQAIKLINESNIICVYGMSMGDTDKVWWETIGSHLKKANAYLIIFDIPLVDHFTRGFIGPQIEYKKKLFLDKTSLNEEDKAAISDRIFVCLTNDMF